MSDSKLEELQKNFERAKKTGHEGWLQLEVQLYIAEKLSNIEALLPPKLEFRNFDVTDPL